MGISHGGLIIDCNKNAFAGYVLENQESILQNSKDKHSEEMKNW